MGHTKHAHPCSERMARAGVRALAYRCRCEIRLVFQNVFNPRFYSRSLSFRKTPPRNSPPTARGWRLGDSAEAADAAGLDLLDDGADGKRISGRPTGCKGALKPPVAGAQLAAASSPAAVSTRMPRLMSISRPSSCATRSRANRLLEAIDVFSTVVADKSATLNARPTGFLRPPRHPDPPDYVGAQNRPPNRGRPEHCCSLQISRPARPVPGLPLRLR